jgi:thioredoxin reductase
MYGVAELARTAAQVYLIAPDAERLSTPLGIALHHQTNVEVHAGAEITEVCGERAIEALALRIAGATRRVLVDRAFVDLGLVPNSALVRGLVDTDAHGFVVVDQHNSTSLPGLFAAGDVTTTSGEHALVAVGDGVRAAQSAHRYLLVEWLAESRRTVR